MKATPHQAKRNLDKRCRVMADKFVRLLEEIRGERFPFFRVTPMDSRRITILWCWSERHKVPVKYILAVLLEHWDNVVVKKKRQRKELRVVAGVSIAALTGPVSAKVLEERIEEDFPEKDNIRAWRQKERMNMLPDTKTEGEYSDPYAFVDDYAKTISAVRTSMISAKQPGTKFTRRPYRDNPWR